MKYPPNLQLSKCTQAPDGSQWIEYFDVPAKRSTRRKAALNHEADQLAADAALLRHVARDYYQALIGRQYFWNGSTDQIAALRNAINFLANTTYAHEIANSAILLTTAARSIIVIDARPGTMDITDRLLSLAQQATERYQPVLYNQLNQPA